MTHPFLAALAERVLIADGAMGTMLQAQNPTCDDFQGLDGCNEILNISRPEMVAAVHQAYFDAGVDAVETNTFGANVANLAEYDIPERITELAEAGARIAREVADSYSDRPRYVLGSMGPGTKLPSLGHIRYAELRQAYAQQTIGLLAGGVDALIVETSQDLLQAKAAIIGAKRAMQQVGKPVPIIAHVTVETTGTMLLGSEIGAALCALEALGIDLIGLNCATGPDEMSEHLRQLSRQARCGISVMPNAGLPELGPDGAVYPLGPAAFADALAAFADEFGVNMVGGCCGTTPEHLRQVVAQLSHRVPLRRNPRPEPGLSSLYHATSYRQDASVLVVGERTNTNGSKAFREAMLSADWQACLDMARAQTRDGAHVLDLCVDYVGRDGSTDMRELASRLATASTLPLMLDSTEPAVIEAGLECLGGRCIVNSVNFEDGDGPNSRYARMMPIIGEHGAAVVALTIDEEGQARTADRKVAIAERLITDLTTTWQLSQSDIMVDCLTFPISTGQEETRRDGLETIAAIKELTARYPDIQTTLGVSNISFGLNAAARQVLNSVFLAECQDAGLSSAIVHASKILPAAKIPDDQRQVALDLIYDRRRPDYDPLIALLDMFAGVSAAESKATRAAELAALPLEQRLRQRIIDGERAGLTEDLDQALATYDALAIINDILLAGMKTVGELFGSGAMQLPFVLTSAEVMKAAVAHLEPHIDSQAAAGKGTIVLATVIGDVHDIGKNLVDIILSNNGYTVVNLGIKQPVSAIVRAAQEHRADAIGMSGLLVKSTVVMKENLAELNARQLAGNYPVLLGGAALTRTFVENDLAQMYHGEVRYARDAFEGLKLMDQVMARKSGQVIVDDEAERAKAEQRRARHQRSAAIAAARQARQGPAPVSTARSDVAADNPVPTPPFWGSRIVKGIALAEFAPMLDERATFLGQWGLRGSRTGGASYEELVETDGRPRLRYWLDRLAAEQILTPAVAYGYFGCYSAGNDLIVLAEPDRNAAEVARFTFPRQRRDRQLCLADFFRSADTGEVDVIAFDVVTMGQRVADFTAELFAANNYRDYLEVHGLSVQLTEALAESFHQRIRQELRFADGSTAAAEDPSELADYFDLAYRGARYAFGYPACPDLSDQQVLVDLLQPERIGVALSAEFQLHPEQSTSALIVHHPEAKYFSAK